MYDMVRVLCSLADRRHLGRACFRSAAGAGGVGAGVVRASGELHRVADTDRAASGDCLHRAGVHPAVNGGAGSANCDQVVRVLSVRADRRHLGLSRFAGRAAGGVGVGIVGGTSELHRVAHLKGEARTAGAGGTGSRGAAGAAGRDLYFLADADLVRIRDPVVLGELLVCSPIPGGDSGERVPLLDGVNRVAGACTAGGSAGAGASGEADFFRDLVEVRRDKASNVPAVHPHGTPDDTINAPEVQKSPVGKF